MDLARESALQLGHDYIGTEHMLLGLIEEGNGVGADVLKRLGVDLNRISAQLKERITPGTALVTGGQLPFTQRAKKTLDLMRREAHDLGHNYMGTEHLLLGTVLDQFRIAPDVRGDHRQAAGERLQDDIAEGLYPRRADKEHRRSVQIYLTPPLDMPHETHALSQPQFMTKTAEIVLLPTRAGYEQVRHIRPEQGIGFQEHIKPFDQLQVAEPQNIGPGMIERFPRSELRKSHAIVNDVDMVFAHAEIQNRLFQE